MNSIKYLRLHERNFSFCLVYFIVIHISAVASFKTHIPTLHNVTHTGGIYKQKHERVRKRQNHLLNEFAVINSISCSSEILFRRHYLLNELISIDCKFQLRYLFILQKRFILSFLTQFFFLK